MGQSFTFLKIQRIPGQGMALTSAGRYQPGPSDRFLVPTYHFAMVEPDSGEAMGMISLRIGKTPHIRLYAGHIGYHVLPPFRGHRLAGRACRLLLPVARTHGISQLVITCSPDNIPSKRTIEHLGARNVGTVIVPRTDPLYAQGHRVKLRYVLDLTGIAPITADVLRHDTNANVIQPSIT